GANGPAKRPGRLRPCWGATRYLAHYRSCEDAHGQRPTKHRHTSAAETLALERRRTNAAAYTEHPALLRLEELATLRQLATNVNARLYLSLPSDAARSDGKSE